MKDFKKIIEAIIFLNVKPIKLDNISKAVGIKPEKVEDLIDQLNNEYKDRSFKIYKNSKGYFFGIRPEFKDFVLCKRDNEKLSKSMLEVLAIIAYNQPISASNVSKIRGLRSEKQVMKLFENGFIKILSFNNAPIKQPLFGVSNKFFDFFGLSSLDELPPIEDLNLRS
ncbi:segregation and condensation protein B [Thermodesulfobium acidiphilum]|uniref:Segregation and condensation protein B n=1 Tax=Thermodesulfobium acidiphilum TaxID=1794699 RepID=A0A2R4W176_THEAF|nr:SMC-Scp complex subunit ScpB [Thermodesulfobium acidiphilum]AWB10561.1 segregation and condensation protein B [Thermodesulfobium acidiphilum]